MNETRPILALTAGLLILGGCGGGNTDGPVVVSVIGDRTRLANPAIEDPNPSGAMLLGAVAQGLVRFDDAAQIVPGLAIRWAISDDGLYYTFRLGDEAPDAGRIARALRLLVRKARSGPLRPDIDGIGEILAVTPEVIEIRLSRPSSGLITLLAAPDFAIVIDGRGSGPLLTVGSVDTVTVLKPPPRNDEGGRAKRSIVLRGERVGRAVARFAKGEAALVTGGTFTDIAYPRLAGIADAMLRMDPVTGLFGLRLIRSSPLLTSIEIRQALSMALDRDAIGIALNIPGWHSTQAILPPGVTDLPQPTIPIWAQALATVRRDNQAAQSRIDPARIDLARRIVRQWMQQHEQAAPPVIQIAMPRGPGSARLFALIATQWNAIGVAVRRTDPGETADMRLIDEVAPIDQADWFLAHFTCAEGFPCSEQADRVLATALAATDPAERARGLAEAEQRLAALTPFIPIAQPIRWSLAAPALPGFKTNARGVHPVPMLIGNQMDR